MLHKLNMEVCEQCGRIVDEDKIDDQGVCKHCYEYSQQVEEWNEHDSEF